MPCCSDVAEMKYQKLKTGLLGSIEIPAQRPPIYMTCCSDAAEMKYQKIKTGLLGSSTILPLLLLLLLVVV